MLAIIRTSQRVALFSPYLQRMVERARQLDGSWSPDFGAWLFRPSAATAVRNAARRHYQQNPDEYTLSDEPMEFPTIAYRALALAPENDNRREPPLLPTGILLYVAMRTTKGRTRWEFADQSAVVQCDGEFFPAIHGTRPEMHSEPYATLYEEPGLSLALPPESQPNRR